MRWVLSFVVALFAVGPWCARADADLPASAVDTHEKLSGEKKVRYLLRQLDLTPEQEAVAQDLIAETFAGQEGPPPLSVDRVREIWKQIEEAKAANDQEKIDELTAQLKQMGRETPAETGFFPKLKPHLTAEQELRLIQAQARLERNPSGGVRPIDLLRIALQFDLTPQQRDAVRQAHQAARKRLGPVLRPSSSLRLELVNICAQRVRELLTPEQRREFERRLRALRPDLIDEGLRVTLPAQDEPSSGD